MRKLLAFLIALSFIFPSCKAKYSFKSSKGKQKLKYYNSIQYDGNTPKPKKKKF